MNPNALPSENFPLMGAIDPQAAAVGNTTSDYADLGNADAVMGVGSVATIGATQTVTWSLVQATDSSGSGAKAISGKSATALVNADDNKQVTLNVRASELDIANGFRYVGLRAAVADTASPTTTVTLSGTLHVQGSRFAPATQVTSVAEDVN